MAAIKRCTCPHAYQDKKYGRGLRVHNVVKGQSGDKYRCTVCGNEAGSGSVKARR